jgi:MFS transporter, OFA family, oxalate/formate antiporter
MRSVGPRVVAITAGILYGGGVFLASLSSGSLFLLYITYGLLGGIGIGLGYIVPIATLVKWFPDKRGFITGIAVAGFGAGALVAGPVGSGLANTAGVFTAFAILGIAYLIAVVGAAMFMRNPPEGWSPGGGSRVAGGGGASSGQASVSLELGQAIKTWQWFALWAILFLNVTAGIGLISEASGMTQAIVGVGAGLGATMVGIVSVGNAAGRFLWAWLSDAIGRKWVFFTMFLLQVVLFLLLPAAGAFFFFAVLAFIIATCYGGGFGTMPAFAADYFGAQDVGRIYGLMLTAWSVGGVLGPLLIAGFVDATGNYAAALYIIAGILLLSAIIPFIIRPPKPEGAEAATRVR